MPIRFYNDTDNDVTIVARETRTGRDGASQTFEPGEQGSIDIDGDHQIVISTTPRESDVAPIDIPVAKREATASDDFDDLDNDTNSEVEATDTLTSGEGNDTIASEAGSDTVSSPAGADQLPAAPDDVIAGEIEAMIAEGANLTQSGKPELPILNERLASKGYAQVDGRKRDGLMPQR